MRSTHTSGSHNFYFLYPFFSDLLPHLVSPEHQLLCHRASHGHQDACQHLLPVDAELILTANLRQQQQQQHIERERNPAVSGELPVH
jgi:hypothetical protein